MILPYVLITVCLCLSGCQQAGQDESAEGQGHADGQQASSTDQVKFADNSLRELTVLFQAELDRIRRENGWPGLTAAFILRDGRAGQATSGSLDLEGQVPLPARARMPIGNVGMTFVSAVVLALVQEGKLALDDRVADWLSQESWFARLPNGPDLTVRMLLNHTSGIPDHVRSPAYVTEFRHRWSRDELGAKPEFSSLEQIGFVLDQAPLCTPGEEFHFAATNYLLAGWIVEKAARMNFAQELQRRFLDPLQLDQTVLARERHLAGVVPGHLQVDNQFGLPPMSLQKGQLVLHPVLAWPAGSMVSCPQDLVRWVQALYEENAMPGDYLADLVARAPGGEVDWEKWCSDGGTHYGLGVFVQQTRDLGTIYGHDGVFPGYHTMVAYFAKHHLAVAMQLNRDWDTEIISGVTHLARLILDNTIK